MLIACRICASAICPIRHFAMTGIDTACWIPLIIFGSLIRATPPAARISAGIRSNAMTAHAPASSAIFACSGVVTSIITPPLSICAKLRFKVILSSIFSLSILFLILYFPFSIFLLKHISPTPGWGRGRGGAFRSFGLSCIRLAISPRCS